MKVRQSLLGASVVALLGLPALGVADPTLRELVEVPRAEGAISQRAYDALNRTLQSEARPAPPAAQSSIPDINTRGRFEVTSADGGSSFRLGGRIHFDGNWFSDTNPAGGAAGHPQCGTSTPAAALRPSSPGSGGKAKSRPVRLDERAPDIPAGLPPASLPALLAAAGYSYLGPVALHRNHYEVLAENPWHERVEVHVDFNGQIYRERIAPP